MLKSRIHEIPDILLWDVEELISRLISLKEHIIYMQCRIFVWKVTVPSDSIPGTRHMLRVSAVPRPAPNIQEQLQPSGTVSYKLQKKIIYKQSSKYWYLSISVRLAKIMSLVTICIYYLWLYISFKKKWNHLIPNNLKKI